MASTTHILQALFIILGIHINPYFCFKLDKLTEDQVEMSNWKPEDIQSLSELSGQFEDDIVMDKEETNTVRVIAYWPNNTIPFEIDPTFSETEREIIIEATKHFEKVSCFKVRPKIGTDADYVYISENYPGCTAEFGFRGGRQHMNLQRYISNTPGIYVHEETVVHQFMHIIGFPHQQNTWNRDQHVDILWENIEEDSKCLFEKTWNFYAIQEGFPYDYYSIMHSSGYAFSKNGKQTIRPKVPGVELETNYHMTNFDIAKLNKLCGLSENEVRRTILKRNSTQLKQFFTEQELKELTDHTGYDFSKNGTKTISSKGAGVDLGANYTTNFDTAKLNNLRNQTEKGQFTNLSDIIQNTNSTNESGTIQTVNYITAVITICITFLCNMLIH